MKTTTPTASPAPVPPSGVAELLAAGKGLAANPITATGREPTVLVPQGFELKTLPVAELPPLPDHIRQTVTLHDAESFTAYVKRYQTPLTLLFATLPVEGKGAGFTAIFDYHQGGKGAEQAARRCAHVAHYPCPLALEWRTWTCIDGAALTQGDFIDFVDANARDILAPDSASLLELAMNFESKTDVQFSSKVDRVTGGRQLAFKETVDASGSGGAIKVPDAMKLRLPVFEGGASFDLEARLEWAPRDGRLKVTVHLRRPEVVLRAALDVLRTEIGDQTGLTALNGKPANG